jgi:putative DNA primase/helicase
MSAIDTLQSIANSELINYDFRYCLVDKSKIPYQIYGNEAKTNIAEHFVPFEQLMDSPMLTRKKIVGIGISIQASNVCAIDVDDCFANAFDISSVDDRGKNILELFEDIAYCEFSFSGHGMRILFLHDVIEDYASKYYIKNSKQQIEYYQPSCSNRFVTVTGRYLSNKPIQHHASLDLVLNEFLESYMLRPEREAKEDVADNITDFETALNKTKMLYFKNQRFQDLWFSDAPGPGKDESEKDFHIIALLYENVTTDAETIRKLFETSPYYKSKDAQHLQKWQNNNYRYFNYIYSHL